MMKLSEVINTPTCGACGFPFSDDGQSHHRCVCAAIAKRTVEPGGRVRFSVGFSQMLQQQHGAVYESPRPTASKQQQQFTGDELWRVRWIEQQMEM